MEYEAFYSPENFVQGSSAETLPTILKKRRRNTQKKRLNSLR